MKYLESFFYKKMTQDDIEDIEDIFESYLDECGKNTFFKGGESALSEDPLRLNTYAFIPKKIKWNRTKHIIIEIWSPDEKLVRGIFNKFQKRIAKFSGFKCKFESNLDAKTIYSMGTADLQSDYPTYRSCDSGNSFYGRSNYPNTDKTSYWIIYKYEITIN